MNRGVVRLFPRGRSCFAADPVWISHELIDPRDAKPGNSARTRENRRDPREGRACHGLVRIAQTEEFPKRNVSNDARFHLLRAISPLDRDRTRLGEPFARSIANRLRRDVPGAQYRGGRFAWQLKRWLIIPGHYDVSCLNAVFKRARYTANTAIACATAVDRISIGARVNGSPHGR